MSRLHLLALVLAAPPAAAQFTWCPLSTGGIDDPGNLLTAGYVEYAGHLYVGTLAATGGGLYRYDGTSLAAVAIPTFSPDNVGVSCAVVHNGALFIGTLNDASGAEVWRFDGGAWSRVGASGFGSDDDVPAIDCLAVHAGQLYAGAANLASGSEVHRWVSGTTWTQVNPDGFGCGAANQEVYGLADVAGALWATTNNDTGCQIWSWSGAGPWTRVDPGGSGCGPGGFGSPGADTGAHALEYVPAWGGVFVGTENSSGAEVWFHNGAWTSLTLDGFGDLDNFIVHDFASFSGSVFAVTENQASGCQVWEFPPNTGALYRRVDPFDANGTGGFGSGAANEIAFELAEFQGRLFASTLNAVDGGEIWELGIGHPYCAATSNSTGRAAEVCATGTPIAAQNDVTLTAFRLPPSTVGYFLNARMAGFVPNAGGSAGHLCLGGSVGRYNQSILSSGPVGAYELVLDLPMTPQPTGAVAVAAGETWHFQSWFRDSSGGMPTSNFTRAVSLPFQ